MEKHAFSLRINKLIEKFDVGHYINIPVRKLSLGQRIRCEIIAELLHDLKVIFLDEPTIVLDLVAKQNLRETLLEANKLSELTFLITSHDIDDIEKLCERVIIIKDGNLVCDKRIEELKRIPEFSQKLLTIRHNGLTDDSLISHFDVVKNEEYMFVLKIKKVKQITSIIEFLQSKTDISDIEITSTPLEEIISSIYLRNER